MPIPEKSARTAEAETIALKALGFLASEPDRLMQFLADTGISLDTLHAQAEAVETQIAVLDYLLSTESELLTFTANAGLEPNRVTAALALLSGVGNDGSPRRTPQ